VGDAKVHRRTLNQLRFLDDRQAAFPRRATESYILENKIAFFLFKPVIHDDSRKIFGIPIDRELVFLLSHTGVKLITLKDSEALVSYFTVRRGTEMETSPIVAHAR